MTTESRIRWDKAMCRKAINRLRDGVPPPPEMIEFLSIGYEKHLERAREGMEKALEGEYDITILEGRYGIGKSHLLERVRVLAEHNGYVARQVTVGGGRVYFNNPEGLADQVLGTDIPPYDYFGRGYYTPLKFVRQLNAISRMHRLARTRKALVILFDELETTFDRYNLPRIGSRIKAYNYLDVLFHGQYEGEHLAYVCVLMAITPFVIEYAKGDQEGWNSAQGWIPNPAKEWRTGNMPEMRTIRPLSEGQALELAVRIQELHSVAFSWNAQEHLSLERLRVICRKWQGQGESRDERQLVRQVIEELEMAEQSRGF